MRDRLCRSVPCRLSSAPAQLIAAALARRRARRRLPSARSRDAPAAAAAGRARPRPPRGRRRTRPLARGPAAPVAAGPGAGADRRDPRRDQAGRHRAARDLAGGRPVPAHARRLDRPQARARDRRGATATARSGSAWRCATPAAAWSTHRVRPGPRQGGRRQRQAGRPRRRRHRSSRGDAFEEIPKLTGTFDCVFVDAWKRDYIKFFDLTYPRLDEGGLFLGHNVINKKSEMSDFLDRIATHPDLFTSIVAPGGEGVSVSYKRRARS